jgi:chromosome segregation ATPase
LNDLLRTKSEELRKFQQENTLLGSQLHDKSSLQSAETEAIKTKYGVAIKKSRELEEQNEKLQTSLNSAHSKLREQEVIIGKLDALVKQLHEKVSSTHMNVDTEISSLKQELEEERTNATKQLELMQLTLQMRDKRIKEMEADVATFKLRLQEEADLRIQSLQKSHKNEIEIKQDELRKLQNENHDLHRSAARISHTDDSLMKTELEVENLKKELRHANDVIEDYQRTIMENDMKQASRDSELMAARQKLKTLEAEMNRTKVD